MTRIVRWKAHSITNQDAYHIRVLKAEGEMGDRESWRQWNLGPDGEWVEYSHYDVLSDAFIVVPGHIYHSGPESLQAFVKDMVARTKVYDAEAIEDIKSAIRDAVTHVYP